MLAPEEVMADAPIEGPVVIFDDEQDVRSAFKIAKGNSEKLSLPGGS